MTYSVFCKVQMIRTAFLHYGFVNFPAALERLATDVFEGRFTVRAWAKRYQVQDTWVEAWAVQTLHYWGRDLPSHIDTPLLPHVGDLILSRWREACRFLREGRRWPQPIVEAQGLSSTRYIVEPAGGTEWFEAQAHRLSDALPLRENWQTRLAVAACYVFGGLSAEALFIEVSILKREEIAASTGLDLERDSALIDRLRRNRRDSFGVKTTADFTLRRMIKEGLEAVELEGVKLPAGRKRKKK